MSPARQSNQPCCFRHEDSQQKNIANEHGNRREEHRYKRGSQKAELVNEVLNLLEILIEEKEITVVRENESVGRVSVRSDRSLLRVAILNVIHNAVKFSPDGSVLRISYAHGEPRDN